MLFNLRLVVHCPVRKRNLVELDFTKIVDADDIPAIAQLPQILKPIQPQAKKKLANFGR